MSRKPLILVADIGNTSTSIALYQGGRLTRVRRIEKVDQNSDSVSKVVESVMAGRRLNGVAIASVVPHLTPLWEAIVRRVTGHEVLWIGHQLNLGIPLTYPKPETIGADRLANAAAGVVKYGAPLIVADFGTAVTFDLVSRRDGYMGGIIAPGLPLMFDYLAERTAQLPHITWSAVRSRVGRSTTEAMQLGAQWGYRGMVREIIRELKRSPSLRQARVCATGGYAARVTAGLVPQPIVDQGLTLFGIGHIYELNS